MARFENYITANFNGMSLDLPVLSLTFPLSHSSLQCGLRIGISKAKMGLGVLNWRDYAIAAKLFYRSPLELKQAYFAAPGICGDTRGRAERQVDWSPIILRKMAFFPEHFPQALVSHSVLTAAITPLTVFLYSIGW